MIEKEGQTTKNSETTSIEREFLAILEEFNRKKTEYEEEIKEISTLREELSKLDAEIGQLEKLESTKEEAKLEDKVDEASDSIEQENEEILEENFTKILKNEEKNKSNVFKKATIGLYKQLKRKAIKYVVLPATFALTLALSYHSPQEYYSMFLNFKERHLDKYNTDDPNIVGIDSLYNDSTSVERSTYDFIGKDKIDYKEGYYTTSVFDLCKVPHF